jgi:hypothetical protein
MRSCAPQIHPERKKRASLVTRMAMGLALRARAFVVAITTSKNPD